MIEKDLHIGHPGTEIRLRKIRAFRSKLIPQIRAQLIPNLRGIGVHGVQNPLVVLSEAEQGFLIGYDGPGAVLLFQGQPISFFGINPAGIAADMGLQDTGGRPVHLGGIIPEISTATEHLRVGIFRPSRWKSPAGP